MEARKGFSAKATGLPVSAKKVRPIADHVRKKLVPDAIALLENLPQKGARFLKKVIESATANAQNQNQNLDEDTLVIKELMIDEGPSSKRIWPRGRGRADRLIKRTCHISVALSEIGAAE
jgi:large subunit ribosomal protein L22